LSVFLLSVSPIILSSSMESASPKKTEEKTEEEVPQTEETKQTETEEVEKKSVSQDKFTAFLSGLPYETYDDDIKTFFEGCGEIREIRLPKFQDTGRCMGYGHVEFLDSASLDKALKKSGNNIGKRYVEVRRSRERNVKASTTTSQVPEGCTTAFVKNLPYKFTEDHVGDLFRGCGAIDNVRLVYNYKTQHFKGFGYVDFATTEGLKQALKMNGKNVNGRNILVDCDTGAKKASYKYNLNKDTNSKYTKDVNDYEKKQKKKEKRKMVKEAITEKTEEEGKPKTKKMKMMLF